MLRKFVLVAGLGLMQRGSPAQLLLALLITFGYLVGAQPMHTYGYLPITYYLPTYLPAATSDID